MGDFEPQDEIQSQEALLFSMLHEHVSQNRIAIIEVNGILLSFSYLTDDEYAYIQRVFAQHHIMQLPQSFPALNAHSITDKSLSLQEQSSNVSASFPSSTSISGLPMRTMPHGKVYDMHRSFHIISEETPEGTVYFNISNHPDIGLSCLLRKLLLTRSHEIHPDLLVFHGNAILDTRDNMAIVFSGMDMAGSEGRKGKKGTTTITLASVLQPNSQYAFLANEDIMVSPNGGQRISWVAYPAEINVAEGCLRQIQADGHHLALEEESYTFWGEPHYMTTAGAIQEAGFKIAGNAVGIKTWVFTELSPESTEYNVTEVIDTGTILRMLVQSIKKQRMAQIHEDDIFGETIGPDIAEIYPQIKGEAERSALLLMDLLIQQGAKFFIVQGGVDRQKLYQITQDILS